MTGSEGGGAGAPIVSYIATWRDAIDATLLGGIAQGGSADVQAYLHRPLLEFLARGGKRTRPALVLLAAECLGADPWSALPVAAAVEHFQAAALIHDDIADHAALRRGLPAVHVAEGEGLAITIGDGALVESFLDVACARGLSETVRLALVRELAEMMARTVEGQSLDVGWARDGRWDLGVADYLEMATLKTAHYSVASPLALGAIVAGAPAGVVEELREAGLALGLAFQIADDLLDLEGTADALGKEPLGDIAEGKRTLAVLTALEALGESDPDAAEELRAILEATNASPAELSRALALIRKGGGTDVARAKATELAREAREALEALPLAPGQAREALLSLPHYVLERTN